MSVSRSVRLRVSVFIISIIMLLGTTLVTAAAPASVTIGVILPERLGGDTEAVLQQTVSWLNEDARLLPETRLVVDYLTPSRLGLRRQVCQFLRGPVVALLSLSDSCSTVRQIQRLAQEFSVPFFVINRSYCLAASENRNGVFLSKAGHLDMLSMISGWVIETKKLGVTVVSTSDQPADTPSLLSARLSRMSREVVRPGGAAGAVRRSLQRLLDSNDRPDADFLPAMYAYVLFTEPARLADILAEADEAGLLTAACPWLLTVDGWTAAETRLDSLPADANVTVAERQLSSQLTALLAPLARHMARDTLDSDQVFVVSAVLALVETLQAGWRSGRLTQSVLVTTDQCQVQPDWPAAGQVISGGVQELLTSWGVCLTCLSYELRATKYGRLSHTANVTSVRLLPAGHWNATWGLDITFPDLFRNAHLIMCTLPWHGMNKYERTRSGALVNRSGLSFTILNTLADELGFTYSAVEPPDGEWGVLRPDGSWSGLVRMLIDGEADVCGAFSLTPTRLTAIDSTVPFYTDYYDLMTPKATTDHGLFIYREPFTTEVWFGILLTMFGTSVVLYIINRASPYYEYAAVSRKYGLFQMKNCLWYMYGATINQGGEHLPLAVSGRLVVGAYWLFTLVCVASYSGNLIATFTVPSAAPLVRDVAELVSGADVGWLSAAGTDFQQMVTNPISHLSRELARMHAEGRGRFYPPSEDVLPTVKAGDWVVIASSLDVRFSIDREMRRALARNPNTREPCELDIVSAHVKEISVVFGLQKRSPYKAAFDKYLRLMQESGLIHAWLRSFMPNASLCLPEPGGRPRLATARVGLTLAEMRGAFLLLGCGLLVAALALLAEAAARRLLRRRRRVRPPPPRRPETGPMAALRPAYGAAGYGPASEAALRFVQELTGGVVRLAPVHQVKTQPPPGQGPPAGRAESATHAETSAPDRDVAVPPPG